MVILEIYKDEYILRKHRRPNSWFVWYIPILQLKDSITRNNASDPNAFYVLSIEQNHLFEFIAPTSEERDRWTEMIAHTTNIVSKTNSQPFAHNDFKRKFITIDEILERHPDLKVSIGQGSSAFHYACCVTNKEFVSLLLENGDDMNIKDDEGNSAIHYAVFGHKPDILELLLNNNADVDAVNHYNRSALHIATIMFDHECVQILMKYGCNVHLVDSYKNTPLDYTLKGLIIASYLNNNNQKP